MRFVLKQPKTTFLPPAQIRKDAADLSGQIVDFVIGEIKRRYEKDSVHAADGMQVGIMAMALAEGNLMLESVKTGLPLEKLQKLRDDLVVGVLKAGQ